MQHKKILALSAFVSGALLLANCSPKVGKTVTATPAPATASENVHYTAVQLEEGKSIYTGNCGKCHKLFVPSSKSVERWESVLPSMIKKAKLTDAQGSLVRAYVMANVKK